MPHYKLYPTGFPGATSSGSKQANAKWQRGKKVKQRLAELILPFYLFAILRFILDLLYLNRTSFSGLKTGLEYPVLSTHGLKSTNYHG
jgi:hypothetical protein